jgi:short-subunit dehydrogenase
MASKFYAVIAGVGGGTGMACNPLTHTFLRQKSLTGGYLTLAGRSIALKFSAAYPVVLLARSASSHAPIVSEIKNAGGYAVGFDADVGDATSLRQAFDNIQAEMGDRKLAAAVYNVGGGFVRKPFLDTSEKEFTAAYVSNR